MPYTNDICQNVNDLKYGLMHIVEIIHPSIHLYDHSVFCG